MEGSAIGLGREWRDEPVPGARRRGGNSEKSKLLILRKNYARSSKGKRVASVYPPSHPTGHKREVAGPNSFSEAREARPCPPAAAYEVLECCLQSYSAQAYYEPVSWEAVCRTEELLCITC